MLSSSFQSEKTKKAKRAVEGTQVSKEGQLLDAKGVKINFFCSLLIK